jgi:hypothetical protein
LFVICGTRPFFNKAANLRVIFGLPIPVLVFVPEWAVLRVKSECFSIAICLKMRFLAV